MGLNIVTILQVLSLIGFMVIFGVALIIVFYLIKALNDPDGNPLNRN